MRVNLSSVDATHCFDIFWLFCIGWNMFFCQGKKKSLLVWLKKSLLKCLRKCKKLHVEVVLKRVKNNYNSVWRPSSPSLSLSFHNGSLSVGGLISLYSLLSESSSFSLLFPSVSSWAISESKIWNKWRNCAIMRKVRPDWNWHGGFEKCNAEGKPQWTDWRKLDFSQVFL